MNKSTKLGAIVQAAHERGEELKISLAKKKGDPWQTWPDDHPHIRAMLKRARELRKMAHEMATAGPHLEAMGPALNVYHSGNQLVFAAAWLRCYLRGDFKKKKS